MVEGAAEMLEEDAVEVMAGDAGKDFCSAWHPVAVNLVGN